MAETIYALASGLARGGVQVVRLSGPQATVALSALTRTPPPPPRIATVAPLTDPVSGIRLDTALVLRFVAPASYTGEDVVELHLHGGRAVLSGVLEALARTPGLRQADPGEFTRRAFVNGKLDLAEAEAVGDLVAAETAAQRDQALRQMGGDLSRRIEQWRGQLIRSMALIEAEIDFPDEDLPAGVPERAAALVQGLAAEIDAALADAARGERVRSGLTVVLAGAPNAGKSSLLNALAQREVAIVSDVAGTTRDTIEVSLDLAGIPVTLVDTAGLRDSEDAIEREGVRRARERIARADLVIRLIDGTAIVQPDHDLAEGVSILVYTKADLVPIAARPSGNWVSVRSGEGMDHLLSLLVERVRALTDGEGDPLITRHRHRALLTDVRAALARFGQASELELAAEDLRLAARDLGRVTGRVDVEDLLDVIFREFCIGK